MQWFHTIRQHSGVLFWILFIAAAILLAASVGAGLYITEIVAGLVLVILGLYKLDAELRHNHISSHTRQLSTDIRQIHSWLGDNHDYIRSLRDRHESRLHRLDQKRGNTDSKIKENYREMVKKIIELENKVNDISRINRDIASIKAAREDLRSLKRARLKPAKKTAAAKKPARTKRARKKPYKGRR